MTVINIEFDARLSAVKVLFNFSALSLALVIMVAFVKETKIVQAGVPGFIIELYSQMYIVLL